MDISYKNQVEVINHQPEIYSPSYLFLVLGIVTQLLPTTLAFIIYKSCGKMSSP